MQVIRYAVLFSIVTAVILIKPIYGQKPAFCTGGQVWNSCGSSCTKTCNTPSSMICTAQCVAKCQCPSDKVWHNGQCIATASCPDKTKCTGGQVYTTCGSCTKTCDSPSFMRCTANCVAKCQCPGDKVWHNGQCIAKASCPEKLTCTSCDRSYSPMPVCTRRVTKTCSRCGSSWWRRRCSNYDCSYNQKYCSCPGYKLEGNVCQTECGGCDNTSVKDQQACLHKTQKTKAYCCEAFHLEDIVGQPRCKKGKCGGTGVPIALK